MKVDPVWMSICLVSLLASVAACALLGGTTRSPIRVDCHDGTSCPESTFCTLYNTCEATDGIVETWGMRAPDAGLQRTKRP